MCRTIREESKKERGAEDKKPRFLRSSKKVIWGHNNERICDSNQSGKKKPPKQKSKKKLDHLNWVFVPGSVVQKTDQYTFVIGEPGKLEVTVRNSDIAKFETRDRRKNKLQE